MKPEKELDGHNTFRRNKIVLAFSLFCIIAFVLLKVATYPFDVESQVKYTLWKQSQLEKYSAGKQKTLQETLIVTTTTTITLSPSVTLDLPIENVVAADKLAVVETPNAVNGVVQEESQKITKGKLKIEEELQETKDPTYEKKIAKEMNKEEELQENIETKATKASPKEIKTEKLKTEKETQETAEAKDSPKEITNEKSDREEKTDYLHSSKKELAYFCKDCQKQTCLDEWVKGKWIEDPKDNLAEEYKDYFTFPFHDKDCIQHEHSNRFNMRFMGYKWLPDRGVNNTIHTSVGFLADLKPKKLALDPQKSCPLLHSFSRENLFDCFDDKTIVFVGDSLSRQNTLSMSGLFHSTTEDEDKLLSNIEEVDVINVTTAPWNASQTIYPRLVYDNVPKVLISPDGKKKVTVAYRRSNWLAHADYNTEKKMFKIDPYIVEDHLLAYIQTLNSQTTVLVLNTGHWWTTGYHWNTKTAVDVEKYPEFSLDKFNNSQLDQMLAVMTQSVRTTCRYLNENFPTKVLWRIQTSSHYVEGNWNSGGHCNFTEKGPYSYSPHINDAEPVNKRMREVILEEQAENGNHFLFETDKPSGVRVDAHPDFLIPGKVKDCTHWCLPGVPDTWSIMIANFYCSFK